MEGAPQTNAENDTDASEDKPEKRKRDQKVGRIIGAAAERTAEASSKKEKVAKESASLMDKLFGSEKAPEQNAVEEKPSERPKAETGAEHHAVSALIEGDEVNLREQQRKEIQRVVSRVEQAKQEQLEVADGHHIEHSVWHNIEVDEHGKAVQETSFEYGHEYYKERAKETSPKSQAQRQHFDEVAGEVALVAAALGGATSSSAPARDDTAPQKKQARLTESKSTTVTQPSILKIVTAPPTTTAGTVGWSVALLVLLAIFGFVVL